MLRVAVVDDEYLVRERVKRCIDWAAAGFEIIGEASNGKDAIALVEQTDPHIVIADISMPYINGLDFAATVKERHPKTKIILLTGYSSFDYARTAITAGVSNYLLKPINQNELMEAVLSLKAQIEQEDRQEEYLAQLKNDHHAGRFAWRQQLFHNMIDGAAQPPGQKLLAQFAESYPSLGDAPLAIALIEIHYKQNHALPPEDRQLWRYAACNIFEDICAQIEHIEFVNYEGNKIAAIMNITQADTTEKLAVLCRAAQRHIREHLLTPVTIGISGENNGFLEIGHALRQANKALRQRHVLGSGSVMRYDDAARQKDEIPANIGTDVLIYMRTGNTGSAAKEIHHLFERLAAGNLSIEMLTLVLSELILQINTFISEKEVDTSGVLDGDLTADSLLDHSDDIHALEKHITEIVGQIVTRYTQNHMLGYAGLVARTKQYIEENYSDRNISLETIAVNIAVNSCYLSSVFKKESGFSIVEYLTRCRMLNAKRLMDKDGVRLAEVAEAVGYNDPYYFSKCFKKMFGMAPSYYLKTK